MRKRLATHTWRSGVAIFLSFGIGCTIHRHSSHHSVFVQPLSYICYRLWQRPRTSVVSPVLRAASSSAEDIPNLLNLDTPTVKLHQKYHDGTIDFVARNIQWVEQKGYETDDTLSPGDSIRIAEAAQARFRRWPHLDPRDIHPVTFGPQKQQFCRSADADALGDPGQNVFVISLARRPARLRHALLQLWAAGVSATIVDAVDGDAIVYQDEISSHGLNPLPGYDGHMNHKISLTTGEVGCFMSHYAIWHHMVQNNISAALIMEDDFDFQEDFATRLGEYLEEAHGEPWTLMYLGRSPVEADWRRVSEHIVEPGYTLWTVAYIMRLEGARALLDAGVERYFAPLDDFFSVAMGRGADGRYNEHAPWWIYHIPVLLRGLAVTPPLVMPYVGSMLLSDTAMLRKRTRYVKDLPVSEPE